MELRSKKTQTVIIRVGFGPKTRTTGHIATQC